MVVALAVVAVGMLAVFQTVNDTVNNVGYLRDRSFAASIADNRLTEMRLSTGTPFGGPHRRGRRVRRAPLALQDCDLAEPVDGLRRIDGRCVGTATRRAASWSHWPVHGCTAAAAPPSSTRGAARRLAAMNSRPGGLNEAAARVTLIEVLVATVILSVMGVMAYRG